MALANFHGLITSNQGSFLLRSSDEVGGVDAMHRLEQAKTIDQIKAVVI